MFFISLFFIPLVKLLITPTEVSNLCRFANFPLSRGCNDVKLLGVDSLGCFLR